jgi:hypothetical protein
MLLAPTPWPAQGQTPYPSQTIKLIVPNAAGGLPDTVSRIVGRRLQEAQELMGQDFWPYGVGPNRRCLEYFLQQHHKQGLSDRLVTIAELFHPATFEVARI